MFFSRRTWTATSRTPWFSREFLFRVLLVALIVVLTELLPWKWLRFFTSEAVLRMSACLGMPTARVSFDTIRVGHGFFRFVVPCTFADVFMGSIPLLWNLRRSLLKNLLRMMGMAVLLFVFNLLRLEIGHVLYFWSVPWVVADSILGGVAYFAVWLVIWRMRGWGASLAQS